MTIPDTDELIRDFTTALSAPAKHAVLHQGTIRADLVVLLCTAAREQAWTASGLADVCNHKIGGHVNPLDMILFRLEKCADGTIQPTTPRQPWTGQPLDWCGYCSDPDSRWALTSVDQPAKRCAMCWTEAGV